MQTLFKKRMDFSQKIFILKKCKNMPYLCWLATFTVASTLMHFAFWVLEFCVCAQKFSVRGRGTATSLCICACVTYSKVPNQQILLFIFCKFFFLNIFFISKHFFTCINEKKAFKNSFFTE